MKTPTAKNETEAKWAERIRAWRASGESGRAFAAHHGFSTASLYAWSRRVSRPEVPQFVRVVARPSAPVAASPVAPIACGYDVVIEIGAARVRVGAGFDQELLADVVHALGRGAQ